VAGSTIAKLAVVVTTDTGPLGSGMQRASQIVTSSTTRMEGGFGGLADRLKNMKDVAGASTGSIRDMAGVLRAGPWALAAAGIAAVGVAAYKAGQAADTMAQRAVKIADEYEAAFKELNGKEIDVGFNKEDTWTGQWDRLKEQVLQFFAIIGENTGIMDALVSATKFLADMFEKINNFMRTDEQKARDSKLKRLQLETVEMKKQTEFKKKLEAEQEAASKKAAAERERAWEAMKRTAESISQSLRRPDEVFKDTVTELKTLFQSGLLSDDIFSRGIKKAQQDLDSAMDRMNGMKGATDQRVAAVERYTMAGFSAAQRNQEQAKIESNTKRTAENTGKQVEWLRSIGVDIKNISRSGGALQVSNL
jgi:hypothetical protein